MAMVRAFIPHFAFCYASYGAVPNGNSSAPLVQTFMVNALINTSAKMNSAPGLSLR
jgi:hypothetical protein